MYAAKTTVSPERSLEEIKRVLRRYGADKFGQAESRESAAVMFEIDQILVRIDVPLPDRDAPEFTQTANGRSRGQGSILAAYEAVLRQRWRALLLAIKAKLEAVECGISTLETEFMPFMVMPSGQTIAQHLLPKLKDAIESGQMPRLMLPEPRKAKS